MAAFSGFLKAAQAIGRAGSFVGNLGFKALTTASKYGPQGYIPGGGNWARNLGVASMTGATNAVKGIGKPLIKGVTATAKGADKFAQSATPIIDKAKGTAGIGGTNLKGDRVEPNKFFGWLKTNKWGLINIGLTAGVGLATAIPTINQTRDRAYANVAGYRDTYKRRGQGIKTYGPGYTTAAQRVVLNNANQDQKPSALMNSTNGLPLDMYNLRHRGFLS